MKQRIQILIVAVSSLALVGSIALAQSGGAAARLIVGSAGIHLDGPTEVSAALPILNDGPGEAQAARINSIRLQGGEIIAPAKMPLSVGTIAAGRDATVNLIFRGARFAGGRSYTITVTGEYQEGTFTITARLRIPPASPGSARSSPSSSPAHNVKGAKYPPAEMHEHETNEDHARRVPLGRNPRPPKRASESKAIPAPKGDPPGINFHANDSTGISGSTTAEPSGAVGKDVIFQTANAYAAYSTNGGASFTKLDPTTIFPNDADGGFCCDQIVQYAKSINRIIWLMQFRKTTDSKGNVRNRYRIAAASPASIKNSGGTAWTYWDITTTQLGISNGWIDYPDLALGDKSLYMSCDWVGTGLIVFRIPLSEIQAGSTIHFRYTTASDGAVAYGSHLTQNTENEIFWAGHNNTTSMRIFSWQESSNTYFWRDRTVGAWNNGTLTSSSPDSQDWLNKLQNFPGNACLGCTRLHPRRQKNQIWFAWTASSGGDFRNAQVQWVAFNRSNDYNLVSQAQIWNSSYAFAYPAFSANSKGELGMSLEYGGPSDYENHVVGFWGDYIVYITTSTDVGTLRFGDYVTIRQDANRPDRFDAFGYGLTGTKADTHYVQFGR